VTSTASDVRYGRRGGRWAVTRKGKDICATCRNNDAHWLAQLRGDEWQVCNRCRTQAEQYSPSMTFEALDA